MQKTRFSYVLFIAHAVFCLFLIHDPAIAQAGIVRYRQVWLMNGTMGKIANGIPAVLYFSDTRSSYVYNRTSDADSGWNPDNQIEQGYVNLERHDKYGDIIYKDLTQNKLVTRQFIAGQCYISEQSLPAIQWKTMPGNRFIRKFNCKRAVARFMGRDYEAWYTMEIPFKTGPWKFHGLPGLILEVSDSAKEVCFYMESFDTLYNIHNQLNIPTGTRKIRPDSMRHIELRMAKLLADSLKNLLKAYGENEVIIQYNPIEKNDN